MVELNSKDPNFVGFLVYFKNRQMKNNIIPLHETDIKSKNASST